MPLTYEAYLNREALQHQPLRRIFRSSDELVIFDVGACEAEDSIRYSRLFPRARIFAFEPLPKNIARCQANMARYESSQITLVPLGISNQAGPATFFVSDVAEGGKAATSAEASAWDIGNKSSSLLRPMEDARPGWLAFERSITIQTTTIEEFIREHQIPRIDFIHMDIQGAELLALQGAGAALDDVTAIWLEVEAEPLYESQACQPEIEAFLAEHNFVKVLDAVGEVSGDQFHVRRAAVPTATMWRLRFIGLRFTVRRRVGRLLRRLTHPSRGA